MITDMCITHISIIYTCIRNKDPRTLICASCMHALCTHASCEHASCEHASSTDASFEHPACKQTYIMVTRILDTCILDTSYIHLSLIRHMYMHYGIWIHSSWIQASWIHALCITDTCIIDIEVDNKVVVSVNFACGTPPERPKGAKDEVKRSEGPPPRSQHRFIVIWRLLSTENESLSRFFCLRVETKFYI